MKIVFNLYNCGLGNNGGSLTIVRSANKLQELGHDVIVIDSGKNMHTWTPINFEHNILKSIYDCPKADVIIATGFKTVRTSLALQTKFEKVFHWIRGWEVWQMSEKDIVHNILAKPTIKIVNSSCLKRKLQSFGFSSEIIRPGNDLDIYFDKKIRSSESIVIGCLSHFGKHRKTKRTDWCIESAKYLKETQKCNIKFFMFGNEPSPKLPFLDNYLQQPTLQQKNLFFNNIHFWLAPTSLEGLHIPPQESMLTGCVVLGTNADMSGNEDYLEDKRTGFVSDNTYESFLLYLTEIIKMKVDYLKKISDNAKEKIRNLGDRKDNMKKLIKVISR